MNQISSFLVSSALDVERLPRRSLAKAGWALDVSFQSNEQEHEHEHEQERIPHHFR